MEANKLIEYCAKMARLLPDHYRFKHYCVITDKRGRIISEAANSYEVTHPTMYWTSRKLGLQKDYVHAEALALIRAKGRGYRLTVVRVGATGNILNSCPCPVCSELIKQSPHLKIIEHSI